MPESTSAVHAEATNALNLALLAPRALQLQIANSLWSQAGYPIEPKFLDLLAREYGAALNTVDYQRGPAKAVGAINQWVDNSTNDKIRQLFSQLDPTTLVLANAVYFKASWVQPFRAEQTRPGPFRSATGATVTRLVHAPARETRLQLR